MKKINKERFESHSGQKLEDNGPTLPNSPRPFSRKHHMKQRLISQVLSQKARLSTPTATQMNVAVIQPHYDHQSPTPKKFRLEDMASRSEAIQQDSQNLQSNKKHLSNRRPSGLRSLFSSQRNVMSNSLVNQMSRRQTVKLNMVKLADDSEEEQKFTSQQSDSSAESQQKAQFETKKLDLKLGRQTMPEQPHAHEAPQQIVTSFSRSATIQKNQFKRLQIIQQQQNQQQSLARDNASERSLNMQEEVKVALKVQTAAIDHVNHNLGTMDRQPQDDSSSDSAIVFHQDQLFTNAHSQLQVQRASENRFFNQQHKTARQCEAQEPSNSSPIKMLPQNVIKRRPENKEEFDRLQKHLCDSKIYLLNGLRDEFQQEHQENLLDGKVGGEYDQSSFSIMRHLPSIGIQQVTDPSHVNHIQDKNKQLLKPDTPEIERIAFEEELLTPNKSVIDFFDVEESHVVHQQVEFSEDKAKLQNGSWLQRRVSNAKPNEVIQLQSMTYKFDHLHIKTPIVIIGQPETVLEVNGGSIQIDLNHKQLVEDLKDQADDEDIVFNTPSRDSLQLSQSQLDSFKAHPLNQGTPLTINKKSLVRIQVCEIRYNRTKAAQYAASRHLIGHRTSQVQTEHELQHFSRDISLGAALQTPIKGGQNASSTALHLNFSKQVSVQAHNNSSIVNQRSVIGEVPATALIAEKNLPVACFVIENNSFVEIKDCFIKSISDQQNFEKQLDFLFQDIKINHSKQSERHSSEFQEDNDCVIVGQKLLPPLYKAASAVAGVIPKGTADVSYQKSALAQSTTAKNIFGQKQQTERVESNRASKNDVPRPIQLADSEINDYCFSLNMPGVDSGQNTSGSYSGLVSLTSTTVQNFMFGVYCGKDAVLSSEASSFIAMRAGGYAIFGLNPKQLKFINGSIQKCEASGVHVILDDPNLSPQIDSLLRLQKSNTLPHLQTARHQHSDSLVASRRASFLSMIHQQQKDKMTSYDGNSELLSAIVSRLTRKIYIENNRFIQVLGCPILVEGPANAQDLFLQCYIKVKDNRISNCGLESKLFAIPGASEEEKAQEAQQMFQAFERIGGEPKACILLRNLHLFELSCYRNTISKGSGSGITLQNVKGHRDDMTLVKSLPIVDQEALTVFERCVGNQRRVTVIDNFILEIQQGYGMVIDGSTCHMEQNQLKKNEFGGLLITTTAVVPKQLPQPQQKNTHNQEADLNNLLPATASHSVQMIGTDAETARSFIRSGTANETDPKQVGCSFNIPGVASNTSQQRPDTAASAAEQAQLLTNLRLCQLKHFCQITIDNSTSLNNQRFGIGVIGFYGTLTIMQTQVNENETDGMVFQRSFSDPGTAGQSAMYDDEAAFLDLCGDYTERSNNPQGGRNRSDLAVKASEQALIEGCTSRSRNEGPEQLEKSELVTYERPFEKEAPTVQIFRCHVKKNGQDGMRSVDMQLNVLGCTIQRNMGSAIRICNEEKGAACKLYVSSRQSGEADSIGLITRGFSGARYKARMLVDNHLSKLLAQLQILQLLAMQVEIMQLRIIQPDTHPANLRARILSGTSELKLIKELESQKSILEKDDSFRRATSNKQNCSFTSIFRCCFSPKQSSGSMKDVSAPNIKRKKTQKNVPNKYRISSSQQQKGTNTKGKHTLK